MTLPCPPTPVMMIFVGSLYNFAFIRLPLLAAPHSAHAGSLRINNA
jgi:hypothetical protein